MKILILTTALLAHATAAPSAAILTPVLTPAIAIPAAIPTIPPGDLQAAAIDAKVQAEDQARAFVDQARDAVEQAVITANSQVSENNDLAKEKAEEAFWAAEDQKWQAYDATNTAQATLDGNAANSSPVVAKSALGGAIIVPAINQPVIAPVAYSFAPGVLAPINVIEPALKDSKPEETKNELTTQSSIQVKTADINPPKTDEKKDEEKQPGVDLSAFKELEKASVVFHPLQAPILQAPIRFVQTFKLPQLFQPLTTFFAPAAHPNAENRFQTPVLGAILKTW